MPTFTPDNITVLGNKSGEIPVEQGNLIIGDIMQNSVFMNLAKYEEMTGQVKEFDVMTDGLSAYWVGEGEKIQTSKPTLIKVRMVAKKLGIIVPVSREYLTYKVPDFFDKVKPLISEAFYKKLDAAAILGVDNPFDFSVDKAATKSTVTGDLTGENFDLTLDKLYDNGITPNAYISTVMNTSLLRKVTRPSNGINIQVFDAANGMLDGVPVFNVHKDTGMKKGTLYMGDFDNAYYGIPYNMSYLISEDATISTIKDDKGEPINLFERELAALRVTMDIGIMIPKDEAFAKLTPTAV